MKVNIKSLLKRNQVAIHVWGPQACFTIPWTGSGGNSMSFPVITGSAARGILGAIYAHPHDLHDANGNPTYVKNFDWVIDKILILSPIQFGKSFGINRRKGPGGEPNGYIRSPKQITILNDVSYIIIGHPHIVTHRNKNDLEKYKSIFNRRCENKTAYTQPHFGWAKYPAQYALSPEICETADINMYVSGYLWKMEYDDSKSISLEHPVPLFIPMLEIKNGIINLEIYEKEKRAC
mgnify:CR=1 FL=1